MAIESLATDPEQYGAAPVKGNYTSDASMHLWCANALACIVSNDESTFGCANADIQAALRYLLRCEIGRARAAQAAEAAEVEIENLSMRTS